MKIIYGTTNRAKLELMKSVADELNFELVGLDTTTDLPSIDESGKDPLENACIKAAAYYGAFSAPVFSCDSGLYFDGLPDALQPGTHIRRVGGSVLTDEQMTEYYSELSRRYGGKLVARYVNAICFIADANTRFCRMDDSLASDPFILASVAHEKRVKGFPLDPLSIDIATGKYYYDLGKKSDDLAVVQGLRAFFKDALAELVKRA
ncbi:MAG: hypothetical protein NC184_06900 [Roseburia sp.]|nr:hypothetical protein [Roseburia sp.]